MVSSISSLYGQNISVYDFKLIQKSDDIEISNFFLRKYKAFSYQGSLGKDKENCDGYKWSNGKQIIELYDCVNVRDGKVEKVFYCVYRIPVNEIQYFQESLKHAEYEIYKEFIGGDGYPIVMWTSSNASKISAVMIEKKGDYFEITSP